jgi:integrase
MQLFKRGPVWQALIYENGRRVQRSTHCRDRKAAELCARQLERDAADPAHAAAAKATLSDALQALLKQRREQAAAGRRSFETVGFYATKAGHLVRILEMTDDETWVPFPLAGLQARHVDDYVSRRRGEGAGEATIAKELVTLRAALKLAVRSGLWLGNPAAVMPIAFSPEYRPRDRFLSPEELSKLLGALLADQAARVAFIVATSACWGESCRAMRVDVSEDLSTVFIRGTKRRTRLRTVPVVGDLSRSLLEYAVKHAQGSDGLLFRPWGNVRRDLLQACKAVKISSCSPNDLRRTCATWLRAAGASPDLIAPVMGHADTRMVERVYGRLPLEDLRKRLSTQMGVDCNTGATAAVSTPGEHCNKGATARVENGVFGGSGVPDGASRSEPARASSAAKKQKAHQYLGTGGPTSARDVLVPGAGIEPATRGFSVPCSTN